MYKGIFSWTGKIRHGQQSYSSIISIVEYIHSGSFWWNLCLPKKFIINSLVRISYSNLHEYEYITILKLLEGNWEWNLVWSTVVKDYKVRLTPLVFWSEWWMCNNMCHCCNPWPWGFEEKYHMFSLLSLIDSHNCKHTQGVNSVLWLLNRYPMENSHLHNKTCGTTWNIYQTCTQLSHREI